MLKCDSRDKYISSHNTSDRQDTVFIFRFCRTNRGLTHSLSLFSATRSINEDKQYLSPPGSLNSLMMPSGNWRNCRPAPVGEHTRMLNFVLFQFHLLKTNYQPISLLTEEQNLFPFFKSYFGIYVTSRICKLCLPSLLKNLQSLFSSYMTFIISFFSYSILHESFIFSICI